MALYRTIQTGFWSDAKVVDDFTPEDKYFYLYLFTNPHTNLCGCYQISKSQMAMELGYSREIIDRLLERFQVVHKVISYDPESKEILIVNWFKYNWTKSEKLRKALYLEICDVKNEGFRDYLVKRFEGIDMVSIPYGYGMDTSNANTNTNSISDSFSDSFSDSESEKKVGKKEVAEKVVSIYHQKCPSLPKVMKLTEARVRVINSRLKEFPVEEMEKAFEKVESSGFLKGEKGDWKANFDWIMKSGNMAKILEGNYDDVKKKNGYQKHQYDFDAMRKMIDES